MADDHRPYHHPARLETTWELQVRSLAIAHRHERGALMPILHALVVAFGYVDPAAVPIIADELNLSQAEVHGVITFYRDFRTTPPGRAIVRICHAEACQAVGATSLVAHAQDRLGVGLGESTPDGAITLDEVLCLGNCALGPSVMVGRTVHGRVDAARLDALLAEAGAGVAPVVKAPA